MKQKLVSKIFYTGRRLFLFSIDSFFFILNKKNKKKNNSITIVRVDNIGDFIIYISSNNLVPKKYINLKKYLICNELVMELAESLDIFDYIIPINIKKFKVNIIYRLKILKKVSSLNTEIVFQPTFSRCFETGDTLVRFTSARKKVGFNGDNVNQNNFFRFLSDKWYNQLIQPDNFVKMELDRNHEFITKFSEENIPFKKYKLPFLKNLKVNYQKAEKYIVISPGSSSLYKNWPIKQFEKLIEQILENYKLNIIICGTKSEEALVKEIKKNINSNALTIRTNQTLLEFIEIIRNAKLVIGNDSCAIHIASFVDTKSICLYGGMLPGRFLPYPKELKNTPLIASNEKCKNNNWKCAKFHNCLLEINVEDVMKLIQEQKF